MKTLYEILEISENASNEVMEKAYKVLAKKYHPDLQTPENKKMAEEKMKQLNEAYSTLSDKNKRAEYDAGLKKIRTQEELKRQNSAEPQTRVVYTTNPNVQNPVNNIRYTNQYSYSDIKRQYERENLKSKLINIRDICIAVAIIIMIIGILWLIPPTKQMMINFYNDNILLQAIVKAFQSM